MSSWKRVRSIGSRGASYARRVPRLVIWFAAVVIVALAGCATSPPPAARQVGPTEFSAEVTTAARVAVNAHIPDEGSIGGTDMAIPFDRIAERAAELPADRNTPLAIYCMTGRMSQVAADTLVGLGYTDIVELSGGMQEWVAEGLPLDPAGT